MLGAPSWKYIFLILCTLKSVLSNCGDSKWQCDNGDCIFARQSCDGIIDCADKSDEIATNCIHRKCDDTKQFRCAYGACVPLEHKCDGLQHCVDNSDETRYQCIPQDNVKIMRELRGHCDEYTMQCQTETDCIDISAICDGHIDCHDHSDESVELCAYRTCQPQEFRCGYGACIAKSYVCDDKSDCFDDSDEAPQLCGRNRTIPTAQRDPPAVCYITLRKKNLNIRNKYTGLTLNYGDSLQINETISFQCVKGWIFLGEKKEKTCTTDVTTWYKDWPSCEKNDNEEPECLPDAWRCESGMCIQSKKLCDGQFDCDDESDEVSEICMQREECEPNDFRCAYGACVAGSAPCNKKYECVDKSDEALQLCASDGEAIIAALQGNCSADSYTIQCSSTDQCIDIEALCDGRADCIHGDDEVSKCCYKTECPPGMFRCSYGACVPKGVLCNGRLDCVDGSDEADCEIISPYVHNTSAYTAATPLPPITTRDVPIIDLTKKCKVPKDRVHLNVHIVERYKIVYAGDNVPSGEGLIRFDCDHTWHLHGPEEVYCVKGEWTQEPPVCQKLCPINTLLRGISTMATCKYNGARINCSDALPIGTTADIECAPGFVTSKTSAHKLTCMDNGEWDYAKFKCTYDCQNPPTNEKPDDVQPYLVNIFALTAESELRYQRWCQGALISPKVIISAVPCFTHQPLTGYYANNPILYEIVIGTDEYEYDINANLNVPRYKVSEILIPDEGKDDIAMAILVDYIKFTANIKPLCLQLPTTVEKGLNKYIEVNNDNEIYTSKGRVINYRGELMLVGEEDDEKPHIIYLKYFMNEISKTLKRFYYIL